MKIIARTLAVAFTLAVALPAYSHHSYAMFDLEKQVTLTGTVKEFQFNNPHCFIQLLTNNEHGTEEWSIEMGAPAHLVRSGWKPRALKPGDKITVVINPLRDGGNGGNFVVARGADGKAIGAQP